MRVFAAAIVIALAQPAFAQDRIPRYGEEEKAKTSTERQAERDREKAYDKSLKNIPDKGPTDPWGAVRSTDAPKAPTAKPKKTAAPQ